MNIVKKRLPHPALSLVLTAALVATGCGQSTSDRTSGELDTAALTLSGPFATIAEADPSIITLETPQGVTGFSKPQSQTRSKNSTNQNKRDIGKLTLRPVNKPGARKPISKPIIKPAPRQPRLVPFDPKVVGGPKTLKRQPQGTALFQCDEAAEDTTVIINGPEEDAGISAGTTLNWVRSAHELCPPRFTIEHRYAIAICAESDTGQCSPANGFYNSNVRPADLGWLDTDPGAYTLNADQIDEIKRKADVQNGDTVYFHIRYNYRLINNKRGFWDTRAFTFFDSPQNVVSTTPISSAVDTFFPGPYSPYEDFSATWNPVPNASYYRVKLLYRAGSPSGSDAGVYNGESDVRETTSTSFTFTERAPAYTFAVIWVVSACNASGCGPEALHGGEIQPMVPANPATSFSTIISAFKAPSCVNCHAVSANEAGFEINSNDAYETGTNFGLPPTHPASTVSCAGCHNASLTPGGSHPVAWAAPPMSMDFRNKTDAQLCQMARDPGTLAENIEDHLLGDPLILWAVAGGEYPQGAGNADRAFGSSREAALEQWDAAVRLWVEGGASCN